MHDIKTRFLLLSDTHARRNIAIPDVPVDVAIHCGDLTNESKLDEFRAALNLLRAINAPLKLVIAGNHDFTLDTPTFVKKRSQAEALFSIDPGLMKKEYGDLGDARRLLAEARADGIVFLDEGLHRFPLPNGARLTVYASPCTPSPDADWGFQYVRGEHHEFALVHDDDDDDDNRVDVVITHGPPRGILDLAASGRRGGCEHLFAAVARSRPRLHCFGHIHEGWGTKLVRWRDPPSECPSHFADIDHGASVAVDSLAALRPGKGDAAEDVEKKVARLKALTTAGYRATDHSSGSEHPVVPGQTTLFVNAAVESEQGQAQVPWVVDLELPAATQAKGAGSRLDIVNI